MTRYFCVAALLAYPVLPLENDSMTDGNSHFGNFKSQTFWSVTSSHLYTRSERWSFNQDLGSTVRSIYGASLLAYPVLPLRMIQQLAKLRISEILDLTSLIVSFHFKVIQ
jgi:hypothetical protein